MTEYEKTQYEKEMKLWDDARSVVKTAHRILSKDIADDIERIFLEDGPDAALDVADYYIKQPA